MMISAIMTCHREGLYAGPSARSFVEAVEHARAVGLSIDPLVVLDRGDELTRSVVTQCDGLDATVFETDLGDPGLARMAGIAAAKGDHVTFLDGDDLWSFNWIAAAAAFVAKHGDMTIANSEINVVFGQQKLIWIHADSTSPDFKFEYLRITNYWDAMCYAARAAFERHPMRANDLKSGYGHEDWHWNCETYVGGYQHRPVPGTVHFKRARSGSQSGLCNENDVVAWPTALTRHSWKPAPVGAADRA